LQGDAKVKNVALKTKYEALTPKNDINHLKRKQLSFLCRTYSENFTPLKHD
jgi:hypothetical protein